MGRERQERTDEAQARFEGVTGTALALAPGASCGPVPRPGGRPSEDALALRGGC
jgi:hypothetical protein